jgi:hypothetical protein
VAALVVASAATAWQAVRRRGRTRLVFVIVATLLLAATVALVLAGGVFVSLVAVSWGSKQRGGAC